MYNVFKYRFTFKTIRNGYGSVLVIFSIYLNSVRYTSFAKVATCNEVTNRASLCVKGLKRFSENVKKILFSQTIKTTADLSYHFCPADDRFRVIQVSSHSV